MVSAAELTVFHPWRPKSLPLRLARTLWLEKWIWLIALPLILGPSAHFIRRIPASYQSRADILIESPQSTERLVSATSTPVGVGRLESVGNRVNPIRNQLAILKSRPLFEQAMKEANIAGVSFNQLSARAVSGTDVIQIRYTSGSPELSQTVVEAVTRTYIQENLEMNRSKATTARQFIENRLPELRTKLDIAQDRLQAFQEQYDFLGTSAETQESSQAVNRIQDRIHQLQADLSSITQQIETVKTQLPTELNSTFRMAGLLEDPSYKQIQSQLLNAETQLTELKSRYTDENPQVRSAQDNRDQLRVMLDEFTTRLAGDSINSLDIGLDPLRRNLVQEWFELENQRQSQLARLTELQKQQASLVQRHNQMPDLIKQHSRLRSEVDEATQTYLAFSDRYTASQIVEQQSFGNVRVLEPARVNRNPVAPNRDVLYALAAVIGIGISLGLVWIRCLLDNRLGDPGALLESFPLTIIGEIPSQSHGRLIETPTSEWPQLLPHYQLLQAHVRMLPRSAQVVSICSWTGLEGGSIVAENLALLEAQSDRRVLLVDTQGSTESRSVLKSCQIDDSVTIIPTDSNHSRLLKHQLKGFDVLIHSVTATLMFYQEWLILMDRLRNDYDLILIDCPPVQHGSQATLLASLSDGVIWVTSPAVLGRRGAEAAAAGIHTWTTRLLGQVIVEGNHPLQPLPSVGSRLQPTLAAV